MDNKTKPVRLKDFGIACIIGSFFYSCIGYTLSCNLQMLQNFSQGELWSRIAVAMVIGFCVLIAGLSAVFIKRISHYFCFCLLFVTVVGFLQSIVKISFHDISFHRLDSAVIWFGLLLMYCGPIVIGIMGIVINNHENKTGNKPSASMDSKRHLVLKFICIIVIVFIYAIIFPNLVMLEPTFSKCLFWIFVGIGAILAFIKLVVAFKLNTDS